ncbi:hypothetical protein [Schaalia sp. lx-100]|uniref:hypothetical protein n=1 Tax=Schaalia sp. lx-100 TaxID=2899081 RepID=UPI001E5776A7|nr:hypothetical protein [Schaalia sp. lx-100]MCD4557201.1 hypothetical protein [Schaalia sp. lx-100]
MRLWEVEDAIAAHGAEIVETEHVTGGVWGRYLKPRKLVLLRKGLTHVGKIAALLHELEHVKNGDDGHQSPHEEERINRTVAHAVITADEWNRATQVLSAPRLEDIAVELNVPLWVVESYADSLGPF